MSTASRTAPGKDTPIIPKPSKAYMTKAKAAEKVNGVEPPWGSIEEVVNAPLIDVTPDSTWISVFGMWVTLALNIMQALVGAKIPFIYRQFSATAKLSVSCRRPLILAWTWWRYVLTGLFALIFNGMSRLALFEWEWTSYGSGDWWYHGEGIWCWKWEHVNLITMGEQARKSAFGCVGACMPDLFPDKILIFLPNTPPVDPHTGAGVPGTTVKDSEWWAIRQGVMRTFLGGDNVGYDERLAKLPSFLKRNGVVADAAKLNDKPYMQGLVVQCIMHVVFGHYQSVGPNPTQPEWLADADVQLLMKWRSYAPFFILPRLLQRFLFNLLIGKVKQLRIDQANLITRLGLQQPFETMNNCLGPYQRKTDVELMDQVMYVFGFAGIGGTSGGVESVAGFLQGKTGEVPASLVIFPPNWTLETATAAYVGNEINFIREVCRLDPPVTSATTSLKEDREVLLYNNVGFNRCNGNKTTFFPKGSLQQYTLSMANRDANQFTDPAAFDPTRDNVEEAFTWNGVWKNAEDLNASKDGRSLTDDEKYPRLCPGRYLSINTIKAIIDALLGVNPVP